MKDRNSVLHKVLVWKVCWTLGSQSRERRPPLPPWSPVSAKVNRLPSVEIKEVHNSPESHCSTIAWTPAWPDWTGHAVPATGPAGSYCWKQTSLVRSKPCDDVFRAHAISEIIHQKPSWEKPLLFRKKRRILKNNKAQPECWGLILR